MPQVSADILLAVPPDAAERAASALHVPPLRRPVHVRSTQSSWRFRPEGDGTRAVFVIAYAAEPAWVRLLAHEVTQWSLRRQAQSIVSRLAHAVDAERG